MNVSHTEETIWSQAVLELRRHGNEVTTFGVVSTINDIVAHLRAERWEWVRAF